LPSTASPTRFVEQVRYELARRRASLAQSVTAPNRGRAADPPPPGDATGAKAKGGARFVRDAAE
jgi:hypothetical protein